MQMKAVLMSVMPESMVTPHEAKKLLAKSAADVLREQALLLQKTEKT